MKVGFAYYPTVFQSQGGVGIKIRETLAAHAGLGVNARLFDPRSDKLAEFDLVHIFGAIHGNHVLVEAAKRSNIPVVLSPVLHPPFTRRHALTSAFCDRLTGRLTGWAIQTSYGQIQRALLGADRIAVLGRREWEIVERGYGIDGRKLRVVPNGISAGFFSADPRLFQEKYRLCRNIVLCVGYISPYKNQLGVIKALKDESYDIVLIGECHPNTRFYLDKCLKLGGPQVHYLGAMDHGDPLLASAYAIADVMVLASRTEVAPNAVLESLAAGTPAIVTKNHSLDLKTGDNILISVDPDNTADIRDSVRLLFDQPPQPGACTSAVRGLTWEMVAKKLVGIYSELLQRPLA